MAVRIVKGILMTSRLTILRVLSLALLLSMLTALPVSAATKADRLAAANARFAPWAKVFEDNQDSMVSLNINNSVGSGFVLNENGYILTNAHVVANTPSPDATFYNGEQYPTRLIATEENLDVALLKIDADKKFKPATFGDSNDIMIGEPIIAVGNPFGMGFTVTSGIVSALDRSAISDGPSKYTNMIQFDAAINPGNSGGALINIAGEVIGIVSSAKTDAGGMSFAIPISKTLDSMAEILDPENRYGFKLGITVDVSTAGTVSEVAEGSPAEAAGVKVGDVVTEAGGVPVKKDVDFYLALVDRKGGEELNLKLTRDGRAEDFTATLGGVPSRASEDMSVAVAGLNYEYYEGDWSELPDFDTLQPVKTGETETFSIEEYKDQAKEHFGLRFTGYIRILKDGVYGFYLASDDGSQLFIGDELVVDHDGLHGATNMRGFIPLKAGFHPIRVIYFEKTGGNSIDVAYEGPDVKKQAVPGSVLYRLLPK